MGAYFQHEPNVRTYYTNAEPVSRKVTREEEALIFSRYAVSGDKTEIVNAYVCWALNLARRHLGSIPATIRDRPGCSEDEAISAANLGLVEAIDKFDVSKGKRFSYYASFWIQKRLRLLHLQQHTVRVPENVVDSFCAMKRLERDGLDDEEIRDQLDLTSEGLSVLRELPSHGNTKEFDSETHSTLHDAQAEHEHSEMVERLKQARRKLAPVYRRVLRSKFDLGLYESEIASAEGVSIDTIRRRIQRALLKLRCYLDC
jgi:RNA polymerase sigma factor (sigma-70 family)